MGHDFEVTSGKVIEAAMAVHKELGPGFAEGIYQRAMQVSLSNRGIPFQKQLEICIVFEGMEVGVHRLDLVIAGELIAE